MELKKETRPFLLTTDLGAAIVNAESPDEAFNLLKEGESGDGLMTYDKSKLNIQPLSRKKGVIYYRPE